MLLELAHLPCFVQVAKVLVKFGAALLENALLQMFWNWLRCRPFLSELSLLNLLILLWHLTKTKVAFRIETGLVLGVEEVLSLHELLMNLSLFFSDHLRSVQQCLVCLRQN